MNPWPEKNGKLEQIFHFKNYTDVRRFTNAVMEIAHLQNHHPDLTVGYQTVTVSIIEHDTGKIGEKCHRLAAAISQAYQPGKPY